MLPSRHVYYVFRKTLGQAPAHSPEAEHQQDKAPGFVRFHPRPAYGASITKKVQHETQRQNADKQNSHRPVVDDRDPSEMKTVFLFHKYCLVNPDLSLFLDCLVFDTQSCSCFVQMPEGG